MRGSRKFCQGGGGGLSKFDFLVDEGIGDPNTAINGPPLRAHQRNAIEMVFR